MLKTGSVHCGLCIRREREGQRDRERETETETEVGGAKETPNPLEPPTLKLAISLVLTGIAQWPHFRKL
jgi:hypothetical protein